MNTTQNNFQQAVGTIPNMVKDFPFNERLSSWETSQLWLVYMADSQIKCILEYFIAKAQDPEIKAVLTDALTKTMSQHNAIRPIFNSVRFPVLMVSQMKMLIQVQNGYIQMALC